MLAGGTAMVVALFGTRYLIVFFRTRGQGQPILGKEDHGPEHHMHKQGTPTMGGIAIVVAALIGWLVAHIRPGLAFSDQTMIVWVGVLFMAAMGFLDDFIKVRKRHNRGIFWKQKNYITMLASFGFAWWLVVGTGISETIAITRPDVGFEVPTVVWIIWAGMIIWATTNAVNVTDGLDGLAAGSALMGFGAFTIIAYWAFRNPDIYGSIVNPLDMGVFAAAFAGGCLGFLWWNAAPARIIMGDVGALALGSALAFCALTLNTSPPARVDLRDQRHRGRLGRRPDGRLQGVGPQASTVPHVADPSPLRVGGLAGDDRDHPLLVDLGDLRGGGARHLHRRLHERGGRYAVTALVYGFAVAGASTARALRDRGVDVIVVDDDIDRRTPAVGRGPGCGTAPDADRGGARTPGRVVRSRVPGSGGAGDARGHRRRTPARRGPRVGDRVGVPLGAGPRRRAASDPRRSRGPTGRRRRPC